MEAKPVCHARKDWALAAEEAAASRFLPVPQHAASAPNMKPGCLRCWELPDACLEILPVPPSTEIYDDPRSNSAGVRMYGKRRRPFRLHVAGLSQAALTARLLRLAPFVKDPLNSEFLRHVENDVIWVDRSNASVHWPLFPAGGGNASSGGAGADDELVMVWPMWEKGYGDVIANTLLPFGEKLREGAMPRHLALSGMRHATLLPPFHATTSSMCAIERDNKPLLPRCPSKCWKRVRICAPEFFEGTRDSWRATVALDAAAGLDAGAYRGGRLEASMGQGMARNPADAIAAALGAVAAADRLADRLRAQMATNEFLRTQNEFRARRQARRQVKSSQVKSSQGGAVGAAVARRRGPTDELHVVIASRSGRRLLANDVNLTRQCDGTIINGTRLACTLLAAKAPQSAKVAALRAADVYVCVWGGDTVHALHMRHGSSVIELRQSGFANGAPWNWLELHKRWVTRYPGPKHTQPLVFQPVSLPTNASVMGTAERKCFERNRRRREALSAKPGAKKIPADDWLCYWNADLIVSFDHLLGPISKHIQRRMRDLP